MIPYLVATPAPKDSLEVDLTVLFPERYVTTCKDATEQGLETCMIFDLTVDEFVEINEAIDCVLIYNIDSAGNAKEVCIDSF